MAQAITVLGAKYGASGGIDFQIVLTADTYTITTGINVIVLPYLSQLSWENISIILGSSSLGHSVVASKSATRGTINIRLWNAAVEEATGALTGTIKLQCTIRPKR